MPNDPNTSWESLPEYSLLVHYADGVVNEGTNSQVLARDSELVTDHQKTKNLLNKYNIYIGKITSLLIITWVNNQQYSHNNVRKELFSLSENFPQSNFFLDGAIFLTEKF